MRMASQQLAGRWEAAFAGRTRVDVGGGLAAILALANVTDIISFSGGFPDPKTFPADVVARLMADLAAAGDASAMQYAPTEGLPGPRAFMADRLQEREGRRPAPQELLITSGGIEALDLVSKSLLDPGDLALVEGPTYLGAIMAFRGFQAEVRAVPVDDEGLQVDRLADELERASRDRRVPKLLYTIPDHQNPAGVTMSSDRREALVELAARYGFLVVEDVAYRELGFDGDRGRLPSLWSLDPEVVVQAGTFSKTFFPGVRLGWAAGPAPVIAQMTSAKQNTDQCAGALGQRLLEEYGRQGHLDAGIRRSVELYARRCGLLLGALDRHMPKDDVTWTRPRGGFFSWMTLPSGLDTVELAKEAMAERVAFVPGAPFHPDGSGSNTLRLAFSRVEDDQIDEGIRRLAGVVKGALR
ncbi:MAG TPA: PLP-dependent aminotransferase family protein [Actinomycetota bacterium]